MAKEEERITRRQFLKGGVATIMMLASPPYFTPFTSPLPESKAERFSSVQVFFVDFNLNSHPNWREWLAGLLNPLLKKETNHLPQKELDETLQRVLGDLSQNYGDHGEKVAEVFKKMNQHFWSIGAENPSFSLQFLSLGDESLKGVEIEVDRLGNPTFWFRISPDQVFEFLKNNSSFSVVNLSLEFGRVGIKFTFYEELKIPVKDKDHTIIKLEEPRINFIDGYTKPALVEENLSLIANLASSHSRNLFVAASGNPTSSYSKPNIIREREKLAQKGQWPPNLIMVGVWVDSQQSKGPAAFGADIYVKDDDLEELELFPVSSSFATPIVSWLAYRLIKEEGISSDKVLDEIKKRFCQIYNNYYVLDFSKLKLSERNPPPAKNSLRVRKNFSFF